MTSVFDNSCDQLGRTAPMAAPDTGSSDFAEKCHRQARAVAASDPAGDELMRFVAGVYEWPDP